MAVASMTVTGAGCAAGFDADTKSDDGPTASTQQAITHGEDDDEDSAVVALLTGGKVICTGVLISSNVVLTAGHCVAPGPPEQVYFGSKPSTKRGTFIDVSDSKVHPDFDEDTLMNDVAVLGLAQKAPVAPLDLLSSPFDASFKGRPIRLVGFGVTNDENQPDVRKRSGLTTIFSFAADDFRFHPSPSQTCNGDSGGPALANIDGNDVVIGVTSSGDANCTSYGRHVRVDTNLEFIQSYASKYSQHRTLVPMENSGCSMTTRAPGSTSSTPGLLLALALAAAAGARRLRSITASGSAPISRPS